MTRTMRMRRDSLLPTRVMVPCHISYTTSEFSPNLTRSSVHPNTHTPSRPHRKRDVHLRSSESIWLLFVPILHFLVSPSPHFALALLIFMIKCSRHPHKATMTTRWIGCGSEGAVQDYSPRRLRPPSLTEWTRSKFCALSGGAQRWF